MRLFHDKYSRILESLNNCIREPNKEHLHYLKTDVLKDIAKIKSEQHRKRLLTVRDVAINKLLMEKHK